MRTEDSSMSCEHIAEYLHARMNEKGYFCAEIEVNEDGENGAILSWVKVSVA